MVALRVWVVAWISAGVALGFELPTWVSPHAGETVYIGASVFTAFQWDAHGETGYAFLHRNAWDPDQVDTNTVIQLQDESIQVTSPSVLGGYTYWIRALDNSWQSNTFHMVVTPPMTTPNGYLQGQVGLGPWGSSGQVACATSFGGDYIPKRWATAPSNIYQQGYSGGR